MLQDKRIIFAGTPDFAKEHLQALLDAGIKPIAVYTQPDRKAGRGHKLTPSPVKELALLHGIEVFTPVNFKDEKDIEAFEALHADIAIVVAYGVLLPQRVIDAPVRGCINIHGSLLPKYRGAAPIQRALLDGESKTGVCIMQIVKALDAGDILVSSELAIEDTDTQESLFNKLATLGAKTLVDNLEAILDGKIKPVAQDESLVTYAAKLTKEEAKIDFNQDAKVVCRKIRGYNPWPVAHTTINGTSYKVFEAQIYNLKKDVAPATILDVNKDGIIVSCSDGSVCLKVIQAPGKGRVLACDFARSHSDIFKIGNSFE